MNIKIDVLIPIGPPSEYILISKDGHIIEYYYYALGAEKAKEIASEKFGKGWEVKYTLYIKVGE